MPPRAAPDREPLRPDDGEVAELVPAERAPLPDEADVAELPDVLSAEFVPSVVETAPTPAGLPLAELLPPLLGKVTAPPALG